MSVDFAGGGIVTTDFGVTDDQGHGIALQADGKILVVGTAIDTSGAFTANPRDLLALARYNTDGSLDTSFSLDGMLAVNLTPLNGDHGQAVAVQADGKILVAGLSTLTGTSGAYGVTRLNSDGSVDNSFGAHGLVTLNNWSYSAPFAEMTVHVQNDGKILLSMPSGLARLNSNGSFDLGFGSSGKVSVPAPFAAYDIAVQADGSIFACGTIGLVTAGSDSVLLKYTASGTLQGQVFTDFGTYDYGASVALQADGKTVIAGSTSNGQTSTVALARYNPDGHLDLSFDGDGKVTTGFGGTNDYATSIALQADGKILVAGYSGLGSSNSLALARYNIDGSLDSTFGGDGKVTTSVGTTSSNTPIASVAVEADGRILVSGYSHFGATDDFVLVRYNQDGSLAAPRVVSGTPSNDTFTSGQGDAAFSGGAGIDAVVFALEKSNYTVSKTAAGFLVRANSGLEGSDTLIDVERLQFTDHKVALDLDGNAGMVAKLIGAVFGASSVTAHPEYVGIGLSYIDGGMSYEDLASFAVQARGASAPADVVNLLWTNVVGSAPTSAQAAPFLSMLSSGTSVGALTTLAADHELNAAHIDLVGLHQTGIEYQ